MKLKARIDRWLPDLPLDHRVSPLSAFVQFLICLAEVLVVVLTVPLVFESNDDPFMNQIASGDLSGRYSPYLMFTHFYIGQFLNTLFASTPGINWYTWYLIASMGLGYTAVQISLSRISGSLWSKGIRHIAVLLLFIPALLVLQFTRVAAVACAGGFMLLLFSARRSYPFFIAGAFLILLGCMIRFQVYYMYLILVFPFLLHALIYRRKHVVIAAVLVISAAAFLIHLDREFYNNNEAFIEYKEFNRLRVDVTTTDSPLFNYLSKKEIADSLGWSENDFKIASRFHLDVDHPKFSDENLRIIAETDVLPSTGKRNVKMFLKHSFNTLVSVLEMLFSPYLLFLCTLLGLSFLTVERRKWLLPAVYFIFTCSLAMAMALVANGNLKTWVAYGMLLPILLFTIGLIHPDRITAHLPVVRWNQPQRRKVIGLLAFTCVVGSMFIYLRVMPRAINERIERDQKVFEAIQQRNDPFYVNYATVNHYPLLRPPYDFSNAYILGWLAGSPWNKKKIESYARKPDVGIYTLFDKKIVWYFRTGKYLDESTVRDRVTTFYQENYPNSSVHKEIIPVTDKDTLHRYTFFIPSDTTFVDTDDPAH